MRIAYITQSYPPMISGAALVAKNLSENMATHGHKVLVITASDRSESYKSARDNLIILRLPSIHNPMRVGQRFLLYPRHAVLKSLHDFQPDIIHVHEPLQMGMLGLEYAQRVNIPILLTIHQLPWFVSAYLPEISGVRAIAETALWTYARWVLPKFTTMIAPTQTIANIITNMTGTKSQTISYGVDLQTFHPCRSLAEKSATQTRLNLPPNVPILLHVGRLDTDKRVDQVIRASAQAMQKTDAHLLIVGDGHQRETLLQLCKSLGIGRRCHFPGYISVEEGLSDIYRMADLFVTASEIETQGIVLLEAAASGLPIAAVRATCIPETVHGGVNGYLSEPNDTIALGRAITDLIMNPEKAEQMGKAGRSLMREHNLVTIFDTYEHLYNDLLQKQTVKLTPEKIEFHSWQERAREWLNL